jgi:hypothetical protein
MDAAVGFFSLIGVRRRGEDEIHRIVWQRFENIFAVAKKNVGLDFHRTKGMKRLLEHSAGA